MGSALPVPLLATTSPESAAGLEALRRTLRALWGLDAAVFADADVPHLAQGHIHLPREAPAGHDARGWRQAAAAHAAAHRVYSPPAFDGRGLKPVVRALVGLLEDARVETLAARELPGLLRWWRPRHTVTPLDGDGVETLLLRLARALTDPAYRDPHPWVQKGRRLFFLDAAGSVLAEPRAERLRVIASRLGHDLGQMRLQFNAKGYRPGPDYRDDHRWMWPAEAGDDTLAQPLPPPAGRSPPVPEPEPAAVHHPEWDRLIARLRPAWCRVAEERAEQAGPTGVASLPQPPAAWRRALQRSRAAGRWQRAHAGERIDLDALLRLRLARQRGHEGDDRVWCRRARDRRGGSVLLLIDQSASTSAAWGSPGSAGATQLQAAARLAWLAAQALARTGLATSIAAFRSNGRHAVRWQQVQAFGEPLDAACHARLAALRSDGSTRLGAALRHAARQLARRRDGEQLLLVISDGEAHDVDVHDPHYLVDDARHAVRHACRLGVQLGCLLTDPARAAQARHIFGARRIGMPERAGELAKLLQRLLA